MGMPTAYESKIIQAFRDVCKKSADGCASPADVAHLMEERKELAELDTVIDIADQMKELRKRGYL